MATAPDSERPWGQVERRTPLVFLHIPKTAGTSLRAVLERNYALDEICPAYYSHELLQVPPERRSRYRLFRGHFDGVARLALPRRAWAMTLLREPADFLLAHYDWIRTQPGHPDHLQVLRMSPEEFCASTEPRVRRAAWDHQTRFLTAFAVGLRLDDDPDPADGARAHAALDAFALVAPMDRVREVEHLLAWTFGWPPLPETPVLNQNLQRTSFRPALSRAQADLVARATTLDRALYRSACDRFDRQYRAMTDDLRRRLSLPQDEPETPGPAVVANWLRAAWEHAESRTPARFQRCWDLHHARERTGWHPERDGTWSLSPPGFAGWWWTGPEAEATLTFRLPPWLDTTLWLGTIPLDPSIASGFRLAANETEVPLGLRVDTSRLRVHTGAIPAAALRADGTLVLRFRVDRTFSPKTLDPASPDERRLGIALAWLNLVPGSLPPLEAAEPLFLPAGSTPP